MLYLSYSSYVWAYGLIGLIHTAPQGAGYHFVRSYYVHCRPPSRQAVPAHIPTQYQHLTVRSYIYISSLSDPRSHCTVSSKIIVSTGILPQSTLNSVLHEVRERGIQVKGVAFKFSNVFR